MAGESSPAYRAGVQRQEGGHCKGSRGTAGGGGLRRQCAHQ